MRVKTTIAVGLFLLVVPLSAAVFAQEPGMLRVVTTHVQLGHQQHFESLIPKLWDAFRKAGAKTPVFVSAGVSDPGAYTFVMPMSSFGDVAAQEEAFGKAFGSMPEVTAEMFGITNSVDDEIWAARTDLSYAPATERLQMAEQGFTRMVLNYPYPAQAQAYEAVLKERAALRKKFGLGDSVNVAQLVIGADGPAYAVLVSAKDELDFYTQFAKDTQKMGAEWTKSLDQSAPLLRRIEFVTFVARPALMYQP